MCLYILYILLDSLLGLGNCTSVRETSFLWKVLLSYLTVGKCFMEEWPRWVGLADTVQNCASV